MEKSETKNSVSNSHKKDLGSHNSASGISLPVVLNPDNKEISIKNIGIPGQYPYTRGIHTSMYRGRLWTMRQYAGFGSALETNQRFRFLLEKGQTGLSIAFDLPTQIGYDADDPISLGEVGKVGVSISSLQDMESLFDQIPLDKVSTSMTINAPAAILLAMYIAVAKKQGVETNKLRGTVQNDILKEYIARGTYIFPPRQSMRLITDLFKYCEENIPRWNTISVSGYHIREAGSNAVQEIAFTLANAITYVQAAIDIGLDIDKFAQQISFFFNAHNDFLEEIAKFRAARRMWAKIMKDKFGATNPRAMMMRFHTQTAGSSLTAQQPENNIARVALQALSSVLGGTQSLHTNSMDEALWLPTENSVQVALRTQQIIAEETGVVNTVDPFAGSYVIEHLTDEIEKKAFAYIQRIEDMGGVLPAIENNFIKSEIHDSAYKFQKEIEQGTKIIVGLNKFETDEKIKLKPLSIDPIIEQDARTRLETLRRKRDHSKVSELLSTLEKAALTNENLLPLFIKMVESDVTLGEITGVLRKVWSEYIPSN
jgi:methylmalonyl-CoA mutase N-terminal domain/subunit